VNANILFVEGILFVALEAVMPRQSGIAKLQRSMFAHHAALGGSGSAAMASIAGHAWGMNFPASGLTVRQLLWLPSFISKRITFPAQY
jgi:hypothetical protein